MWRRSGASAVVVAAILCVSSLTGCSSSGDDSALSTDEPDAGAEGVENGVTILSPEVGEVIEGPVSVEIDPGDIDTTGETEPADAGGRFHLMVDRDCLENGEAFPTDADYHFPFEVGATELEVELVPGAHELCVQFGNAFDLAYYSEDTTTIRVTG
jgi:hypothetical protein